MTYTRMVPCGTSADQDNRFSDKEKKLLKSMKFEDILSTKIDMKKVKMEVLKPWITKRTTELLKMEDDVVVEFIFNQLEDQFFPLVSSAALDLDIQRVDRRMWREKARK